MYQEELTIDVKDFVRRCLKRWKFLLICMLVGAAFAECMGAAYSVKKVKDVKTQIEQKTNAESKNKNSIDLKEYVSSLTEREISEVQTAFSSYKSYQQEYTNGVEYCQNSIRMHLNPDKVPTIHLGYIIDNHYEVAYPVIEKRDTTDTIINTLAEQICSEEVSQQIADAIGLQDNVAYAQELISSEVKDRDILVFSIIAEKKEDCQKIAEIIKQTIDAQIPTVRAVCGNFDATLAIEQYMEETNTQLMTEKQNRMITLNGLKNSISNLSAGMTEEQIDYYNALRDNEDSIVLENSEVDPLMDEAEEQDIVIPNVRYFGIEWIVIGAVIGILIGIAWLAFRYLMLDTLRVPADIESAMRISLLGCVNDKSKKSRLFRKRQSVEANAEEQMQIIAAKIGAVIEKEKISNMFIGCVGKSEKMLVVCENMRELLKARGIMCNIGLSMLYNTTALHQVADTDAMILVGQIDVSRYEEIVRTKELCVQCHVPVLGCMVVE